VKFNTQLVSISNESISRCSTPTTPPSVERTIQQDNIPYKSLGDKIRDKCVGMLYTALSTDSYTPGEVILQKCLRIEAKVYENASTVNNAYKSKIRSLQFNLKVKENFSLRQRVIGGQVNIENFVCMSAEELASEDKKAEMAEAEKLNMMDAVTAEGRLL
jgi:transcription elongation factor S-II